jgi:hypothetical protein
MTQEEETEYPCCAACQDRQQKRTSVACVRCVAARAGGLELLPLRYLADTKLLVYNIVATSPTVIQTKMVQAGCSIELSQSGVPTVLMLLHDVYVECRSPRGLATQLKQEV